MDQIIIELIGDPSGLRPAADALRDLSRVSRENMDAFHKANDAANKYAASTANAARASKGLGEATDRSLTAISGLHRVIASGAMQTATEDIKKYSQTLTQSHTAATAQMQKADLQYATSVKASTADITKTKQDAARKQTDIEQQAAAEAIQIARQVSDAIFAEKEEQRQANLSYEIENLNAQKNAELLNTTLTASQRNAIQKKYRAEEANEKLKAWKADQKAKEEQALINGLLAFTTSLAGGVFPESLIPAALALATAGVEAALIASHPAPRFAGGTPGSMVTPPGMKWVGEQGPELIYTPGGEKIITHPDSLALLDRYRIPHIPDVSHLLDGTGVHIAGGNNREVVEAISTLRHEIKNLKQVHVSIDRNGYKLSVSKGDSTTEYLNNKARI